MSINEDPRSVLATLDATNERLAGRMSWPLWRHMAFGAVMTAIVAASGLPREIAFVIFALAMLSLVLLIRSDKQRDGIFVNGYQRGRTRWVTGATIALALGGLLIVGGQGADGAGKPLFWLVLGVLFVGTSFLSVLWERVYRKEIRDGRL